MGKQQKVEVSPEALKYAEELWANFTRLSKYAIYVIAITLVVMAVVFVQW